MDFFLGREHKPSPSGEGETPPYTHHIGAFGASILELGTHSASSPHLLILEPPLFGSHTSFLGNDPCLQQLLQENQVSGQQLLTALASFMCDVYSPEGIQIHSILELCW